MNAYSLVDCPWTTKRKYHHALRLIRWQMRAIKRGEKETVDFATIILARWWQKEPEIMEAAHQTIEMKLGVR